MLGEAKTKTRPFCQRSKTFGYLILRNKYSLFWPQKQELPQFFLGNDRDLSIINALKIELWQNRNLTLWWLISHILQSISF